MTAPNGLVARLTFAIQALEQVELGELTDELSALATWIFSSVPDAIVWWDEHHMKFILRSHLQE